MEARSCPALPGRRTSRGSPIFVSTALERTLFRSSSDFSCFLGGVEKGSEGGGLARLNGHSAADGHCWIKLGDEAARGGRSVYHIHSLLCISIRQKRATLPGTLGASDQGASFAKRARAEKAPFPTRVLCSSCKEFLDHQE